MKVREVGSRGMLFTFDDEISVYLIRGRKKYFLCDTHLGPLSMDALKPYLAAAEGKNLVVFNSHSDWDHVWGNCAFPGSLLVAHEYCRDRLIERGIYELSELADYQQGKVVLRFPELVFSDRLHFAEERVEFIHAPGHTRDSAICYDREEEVLFIGDLVESPIPYLDDYDLEGYLATLDRLRHFPAKMKISAHSGVIGTALIEANMHYVEQMLNGIVIPAAILRGAEDVHRFNRNNRLFLQYEQQIREELGGAFCYQSFRRQFPDLKAIEFEVLRKMLERYSEKCKYSMDKE